MRAAGGLLITARPPCKLMTYNHPAALDVDG